MSAKRYRLAAFSLVEVTLALGVATFCLVGVIGLLPVGITSNRTSINQTAAAGIAKTITADLRASAAANKITPLGESHAFKIPLPFNGTNTVFLGDSGELSGSANQDASPTAIPKPRYRATIYFTAAARTNATVTRILITWPALADPTAASPPSKYAGSLEAVTALDLN
jgi:hypothetical protein